MFVRRPSYKNQSNSTRQTVKIVDRQILDPIVSSSGISISMRSRNSNFLRRCLRYKYLVSCRYFQLFTFFASLPHSQFNKNLNASTIRQKGLVNISESLTTLVFNQYVYWNSNDPRPLSEQFSFAPGFR